MAGVKVRNTTVSGGMSGVDGEINKVFAYTPGKSYSMMKKRGLSVNPNSSAQQAVRAMFAQTSAGWSGLTEVQRAQWNADAPNWAGTDVFGDKAQSGKNLYTGVNVVLMSAGKALTNVPLSRNFLATITTSGLVNVAGVLTLNATVGTASANNVLQLSVSKQKSAGTSKNDKLVILLNVATGANIAQNVTAAYVTKYGALQSGKKIFYQIKLLSTGGNSVILSGGTIINP